MVIIRRNEGRKDREEGDEKGGEEQADEKTVIIGTSGGWEDCYLQIFSALISVIFQDVFCKEPVFIR